MKARSVAAGAAEREFACMQRCSRPRPRAGGDALGDAAFARLGQPGGDACPRGPSRRAERLPAMLPQGGRYVQP